KAVDQVNSREVPLEKPVEVLVCVVGPLVGASMANAELVGNLKQGTFVLAQQLRLQEFAMAFQYVRQLPDSRPAVLAGGSMTPKQADGVGNARVAGAADVGQLRYEIIKPIWENADHSSDVIAFVGEAELQGGRGEHLVDPPPVQRLT